MYILSQFQHKHISMIYRLRFIHKNIRRFVWVFKRNAYILNVQHMVPTLLHHTTGSVFHEANDQWEIFLPFTLTNTVRCRYNAVNILQISHNRPWVWSLIYVLLLSLRCHMSYRDELDRVTTALDCIPLNDSDGQYHYSIHRNWNWNVEMLTLILSLAAREATVLLY